MNDLAGASAATDARMYGNSGAKASIDIALHDLLGRASSRSTRFSARSGAAGSQF